MSFESATEYWIAEAADPENLKVRARTYPKARGRLKRALDKLHQRKVILLEQIELPPELSALVREHQRQIQVCRELTATIRQARIPLAERLLALRLGLHDVANLLTVSTAQLTLLLSKKDACTLVPEHDAQRLAAE